MDLKFSIIIPVYNRPDEIDELLKSLTVQIYPECFEVIVVDDGSDLSSEEITKKYKNQLKIKYYYKKNSGPGLSRNYAMSKADGNYFIILDSDCMLPEQYLSEVSRALTNCYTDAYGGPDTLHESFSTTQKAINYAMTSFLTTGGIRGKKNAINKFQPRSFNMGLSKLAFVKTNGFGNQHYGEDIDLTFRLWEYNFETQLIKKAFVYHKRRTDLKSFFNQTFNFGAARPILNKQHLNSANITYWFPSLFIIGLIFAIVIFLAMGITVPILIYVSYFLLIFIDASIRNKNILVGLKSVWNSLIQFLGYGLGFFRSIIRLQVMKRTISATFPEMFK